MRKTLWGLFVAGALWAQQAAAVNTENYDIPYVTGSFLYEISDGVRDSQNGYGFQLGGGMPLNDHTAVELNYFGLQRKRDIDGLNDYQNALFANYVYDFGMFGFDRNLLPNFKPFVQGGPGYVVDDVRGFKHRHFGLDGGGGALIPLAIGGWDWGWAVRTEAGLVGQYDRGFSVPGHATLWDWHLTVGLQIPLTPFFKPHQAAAPAEPECKLAVVNPVTGRKDCMQDSDGDGVPDSLDQCPNTPPGTKVDDKGCPIGTVDSDGDGVPDSIDQCPDTPAGVKVDEKGCAIEQTVVLQNVNFETNSAVLTGQATKVLDGVAAALKGQPNMHVEIGGHTDNVGAPKYNLVLSQQRAESVRQYLIGRGVEPQRMTTQGYGETQPMVSNNTEEGRALNRRVEFKIVLQ
ncbi:MAG: OmpA family protein [Nevskia sp.]|nr:OmpA family protein [Nevskia sp.]